MNEKGVGYACNTDLGQCGYSNMDLGQCGYSNIDLGQCGYSNMDLGQCGCSNMDLGQCGYSNMDLGQCGYSNMDLGQYGFPAMNTVASKIMQQKVSICWTDGTLRDPPHFTTQMTEQFDDSHSLSIAITLCIETNLTLKSYSIVEAKRLIIPCA